MKRLFYFLLFFSAPLFCLGQGLKNRVKLDQYLDSLEANNRFMGSVSIYQDGISLYTNSVGFSDIELKRKNDGNSNYGIGSISKTYTAVLILKAVEENKLQLDQPIKKWFPALENADKIRITDLLWQRSGIHDFTSDTTFWTWNTQPKTRVEILNAIVKNKSDFESGTKFKYSNSNYVLLSFILEEVYAETYGEILENKITRPLNLKNTYLANAIDNHDNECSSYISSNGWVKSSQTHPSISTGAGGIIATSDEVSKFIEALFNKKIISASSLMLMTKMQGSYGMGIMQDTIDGAMAYWHNGGIDGFSSELYYFPGEKISLTILSNGSNYDLANMIPVLWKGVHNKPFKIPDLRTYAGMQDLDEYVGTYSLPGSSTNLLVAKDETTLTVEIQGVTIPLEAVGKNKFKLDKAGMLFDFEFHPADKSLTMVIGGTSKTLIKQ